MISIKKKAKNKNRSKYSFKKTNKYNISIGGEDKSITQKICKGRTKEDCNDESGNCKYIEGDKRKYCKRVSRCKKSCDYPCSKIKYNEKMYCIPPDKDGNPQQIEDVKEILNELIAEDATPETDEQIIENIEVNQDIVNQDLVNQDIVKQSDIDASVLQEHPQLNDNIIINKKIQNIEKQNIITDTLKLDVPSEEKGSIASILYGKSNYDNNVGSCSIL
jgi:hypothetical protein